MPRNGGGRVSQRADHRPGLIYVCSTAPPAAGIWTATFRPLRKWRIRPPRRTWSLPGVRDYERTFMRRVATGELPQRLRNCVTDQLTENPARVPRGVRSFGASGGKALRAAVFA